ncbi:MAG TPA: hypothetical protein VGF84_10195 [Micromonosporaceae bacterium]
MTRRHAWRRSTAVLIALTLAPFYAGITATAANAGTTCGHVANDFNGDGYADVASGTPLRSFTGANSAGSVQIDYGGPTGIVPSKSQYFDQASPGMPGSRTAGNRFGNTLVSGYFNDDCYADLAIGATGFDVGPGGNVIILYGSSSGLTTTGAVSLAVPSGQSGFGVALAAGDFNHDGHVDLAVGAPFTTDAGKHGAGAVDIFTGSAAGPSGTPTVFTQSTDGIAGTSEVSDEFGYALAAADFNHDGYDDLGIGTPGESDGTVEQAGALRVVYGSATGLSGPGSATITQATAGVPGVNEEGDRFGEVLAAGDVNNDGYADLVVGVPREAIGTVEGAGDIAYLPGGAAGVTGAGTIRYSEATAGVPGDTDRFNYAGDAVAIGDFDHDGYRDIAVGVPGDTPAGTSLALGSVLIFKGSAAGPTVTGVTTYSELTPGVPSHPVYGDYFGYTLLPADIRGTGRPDLVVSAPQTICANQQEECGTVYVLLSQAGSGLTGTGATAIAQAPSGPGPQTETDFGQVLG